MFSFIQKQRIDLLEGEIERLQEAQKQQDIRRLKEQVKSFTHSQYRTTHKTTENNNDYKFLLL